MPLIKIPDKDIVRVCNLKVGDIFILYQTNYIVRRITTCGIEYSRFVDGISNGKMFTFGRKNQMKVKKIAKRILVTK